MLLSKALSDGIHLMFIGKETIPANTKPSTYFLVSYYFYKTIYLKTLIKTDV